MDKFKIHKAHKMSEWIENQVTEWALELIQNHFGVDGPEELSRNQLDEIIVQWEEMLEYVDKYPEAGMLGLLLLYPAQNDNYEHYIQCAGGQFTNGKPDHFGSGLVLENKSQFKQDLEVDDGRYLTVREVAWTTFGGCYLRRSFIDTVGDFSPEYEWTYNRDVDYCLKAREAGEHIYQIPVRFLHHESRDNKRIKDQSKAGMEMRNLQTLLAKWANSKFYKTLDKEIKSG